MDQEEFDAVVLKAFTDNDAQHGLRASDVHGHVAEEALERLDASNRPAERELIEASIDRLLEAGAIRDVSDPMDWHTHYRAVPVLDRLARIQSTRRPSSPRDRGPDGPRRRSK